jgi:hypothetical protein
MPGDESAGEAPVKEVKKRESQKGVPAGDGSKAATKARSGLPALLQHVQDKQYEHNAGKERGPGK